MVFWRWCSPGLPAGDVVLPVRLPQGAGKWAHLAHFLADPSVWHKIDLVRIADRKAPGGWRYYAHLLVHQSGHQSPATRARRAEIPAGRRAGVDANVSNLAVASFPDDQPDRLVVDQIDCTPEQQKAAQRAADKARARQKACSDHASESRSARQAKLARADQVATRIVAAHGNTITVEDCRISTWARLWGKRIQLFSPGMLVAALKRECESTGGALYRAGTRTTALSQHCLCGSRVPKTLAQRTHDCGHCGLIADRDVTSAMLAACVALTDPDDPRTARVDYKLAHALRAWLARVGGLSQPAPVTSTIRCWIGQDRQPPPTGGGLC
jgi:transposase